jgi:hypothetical protein
MIKARGVGGFDAAAGDEIVKQLSMETVAFAEFFRLSDDKMI